MTPRPGRFPSALVVLALFALLALAACGGGAGSDLLGTDPNPPSEPPPAPPEDPPEDPPTNATSMSDAELAKALEVLDQVNAERALVGQPALAWDDAIAETAYLHSLDMDVRAFFDHTNPDGLAPWDRLTRDGVPYLSAGENIYWASWSATPTQAMDAWMSSTGHRENIQRAGWTHTGIGVHESAGGSWWTQVFVGR